MRTAIVYNFLIEAKDSNDEPVYDAVVWPDGSLGYFQRSSRKQYYF